MKPIYNNKIRQMALGKTAIIRRIAKEASEDVKLIPSKSNHLDAAEKHEEAYKVTHDMAHRKKSIWHLKKAEEFI